MKSTPTPRQIDSEDPIEQVASEVEALLSGLSLKAFRCLWRHRGRPVAASEIWKALYGTTFPYSGDLEFKGVTKTKTALLDAKAQASKAATKHWRSGKAKYKNPPQNVRERCSVLAKELRKYFHGKENGYIISLGRGFQESYQIDCTKLHDKSLSRAFWNAHVESPTLIIYTEQLFYQNWSERLVFRYYDCNGEHTEKAEVQLRTSHPHGSHVTLGELAKHFPPETTISELQQHLATAPFIQEVKAVYPYVAWGEITARDLIREWFHDKVNLDIRTEITRSLQHSEQEAWRHSLILFGAESGNHFIETVLLEYPDLPIRLQGGGYSGKIFIKQISEEDVPDETRMAEKEKAEEIAFASYKPERVLDGYTLSFNPTKDKALAILTRVPNPRAADATITIFNSDFGRAIQQMTFLLTGDDEIRLHRIRNKFRNDMPLPESFQVLCAVMTHQREQQYPNQIEVLAIRPYYPKTI